MTFDGASRRRALGYLLAALSLVAFALACWALTTGGFRTYVFGSVPFSVRGAFRPAVVAVLSGVASLQLLDGWRWRIWSSIATRLTWAPAVLAAAAALGLLIAGAIYGTTAAGGADVYGYVSQASLWLKGTLVLRQDFVATMPWPNAAWSFSPLGYRPADFEPTIMPTYAPGTPLLMAAAQLATGSCGPFLVGPICGAALVWLTYRLGVLVSDRIVALIAACCVATSPTVVFMTNWPMSDVPAATFWTAALLAATGARRYGAMAAGLASGIAITIRPNLAPLSIVPAAILFIASAPLAVRMRRLALFSLGLLPFVAFVAWLFNHLYGSPLRSGYGELSVLFAWSFIPENLRHYAGWFYETQGPLAFACLASPVLLLRRRGIETRPRLLLFLFALLLFGMYLVYTPFDFWTDLRFLLPAFPVAFILAADVVRELTASARPSTRAVALVLFAVGTAGFGLSQSDARDVLALGAGEQKFADVGRYAGKALPENAVVYAWQHGGSVRFYGNRLTLRFELLESDWLDRSLDHLRRAGYVPYLLLEEWEMGEFRKRFAGQDALALLERQPLAITRDGVVRIYATGSESVEGTAVIPKTSGCVEPHPEFGH